MDDEIDEEFSDISEMSSEDDLDEIINEERIKNAGYLDDTVPNYSEEVFFEHFRLSRNTVNDLSERYSNSHYYNARHGPHDNIPALHQILIYLWYMGHQTASFRDVGDRFHVSISSVNRIINRVTIFLSNLSPQMITWPDEDEKRVIETHFRQNGFPQVIGAIDGTHIRIDKPEIDPESYINRKGYYSIQLQAVCDHKRRIRDVFLGFPGSVHDSRVFRNSALGNNLGQKCGQYIILGDSGYPLLPKLMTPYKDRGNLTQRQLNFNLKLARNRYVIEHCFGILKQKFRQMYHVKLRNIRLLVHFIRAACVLHNAAINDNFLINANDLVDVNDVPGLIGNIDFDEDNADDNREACEIRNRIASNLEM